jgi:hypothetical protein
LILIFFLKKSVHQKWSRQIIEKFSRRKQSNKYPRSIGAARPKGWNFADNDLCMFRVTTNSIQDLVWIGTHRWTWLRSYRSCYCWQSTQHNWWPCRSSMRIHVGLSKPVEKVASAWYWWAAPKCATRSPIKIIKLYNNLAKTLCTVLIFDVFLEKKFGNFLRENAERRNHFPR